MSWLETTRRAFWYRPKNSIFYGDTSKPEFPMPPSDTWHLCNIGDKPLWACFVGLRIWTPVQRPMYAPHVNTNLTVAVRKPGDESISIGSYIAQAQCLSTEAGERINTVTWVGLDLDGCFEWAWQRNIAAGEWPDGCSYGVNIEALEIAG